MTKEHRIQVKIVQIDNGFVLHLFDELSPASNDHDVFLGDMELVLDAIRNWCQRLGLIEKAKRKEKEA